MFGGKLGTVVRIVKYREKIIILEFGKSTNEYEEAQGNQGFSPYELLFCEGR